VLPLGEYLHSQLSIVVLYSLTFDDYFDYSTPNLVPSWHTNAHLKQSASFLIACEIFFR
jgi:type VI protein secretion system component Hcp